jgi:hypothetical protein
MKFLWHGFNKGQRCSCSAGIRFSWAWWLFLLGAFFLVLSSVGEKIFGCFLGCFLFLVTYQARRGLDVLPAHAQPLDCSLHPVWCVLHLRQYILNPVYILYIPGGLRVSGMGMGPPACWRGAGTGCKRGFPPPFAPKSAPNGGGPKPPPAFRWRFALGRKSRTMPLMAMVRSIANLAIAFDPGWRSRSTSVPC